MVVVLYPSPLATTPPARHSGESRNPACLGPKLDPGFRRGDGSGWRCRVLRHWPQPQPRIIPAKAGIQLVCVQSWHDGSGWRCRVLRRWPQPHPPVIPAKAGMQLVCVQSCHDGIWWWCSVLRHWPQPQPPVIPAKAGIQLVCAQSSMPASCAGMMGLRLDLPFRPPPDFFDTK